MVTRQVLLLLALLQVCGCFWLQPRQDESSAIGVDVLVRPATTGPELEVRFFSAEGDWSYGDFPEARLDGVKIMANTGATILPVSQRYTPDPQQGGHLFLTLPPLDAAITSLHVEGHLQATEAGGRGQFVTDIAQDVVVSQRSEAP